MPDNIVVRPRELLQALRGSTATEGFESYTPETDPQREEFRARVEVAQRLLASSPAADNVFGSIDDRMTSLMQSYLAREGTQHGARIDETDNGFEAKFDNVDPGWIWSLHDWVRSIDKNHEFLAAPAEPTAIASDIRLAVLSDWGTGAYGAPVCAKTIANDPRAIDVMLHLGDVYYAGAPDETKDRFLAHWPQRKNALHRALNGNHEMYSGGYGYFDLILKEFQQPASYFALRTEHWLIVGLDTAFWEHDLFGEQTRWLMDMAAAYPQLRIMLFTHHQPFSYFESGGPKLVQRLNPLLMSHRIGAWYWGHEHSCTRYELHEGWQMWGRCVGHSGFPYFRSAAHVPQNETQWRSYPAKPYVPGCQVLDGPNPYVSPSNLYGPNGYVLVELQGPKVHESYHDPEGVVLAEFDF